MFVSVVAFLRLRVVLFFVFVLYRLSILCHRVAAMYFGRYVVHCGLAPTGVLAITA